MAALFPPPPELKLSCGVWRVQVLKLQILRPLIHAPTPVYIAFEPYIPAP
jgi:hypothetical protein